MTHKEFHSLKTGLYRVNWKEGGFSYASIVMCHNGNRWLAPTNWVAPVEIVRNLHKNILTVELLFSK